MKRGNFEPEYRRRIREKVEENQRKADRERDEAKRKSEIEKISYAVHRIEKELNRANNEDRPKNKIDRWWERAGVVGLWAAAIVGLIAICVASRDAADQRGVMQRQLDEMQVEQRPWIDAYASVAQPFVYEPSGTNISLAYTLYNSGHSPANNVRIELASFPELPDGNIYKRTENICRSNPAPPGSRYTLGFTLFPNETDTIVWGSIISKDTIDRLNSQFKEVLRSWAPIIIACIVYSSATGKSTYHTPLILKLRMKRSSAKKRGHSCCAISIDDSPIPISDLEVQKSIFSVPAD